MTDQKPIEATPIGFLSTDFAIDAETGEPRIIVFIENTDGSMTAGALTLSDAADLSDQIAALLEACDPEE